MVSCNQMYLPADKVLYIDAVFSVYNEAGHAYVEPLYRSAAVAL